MLETTFLFIKVPFRDMIMTRSSIFQRHGGQAAVALWVLLSGASSMTACEGKDDGSTNKGREFGFFTFRKRRLTNQKRHEEKDEREVGVHTHSQRTARRLSSQGGKTSNFDIESTQSNTAAISKLAERDTFLYATEIDNLDENHPLKTPRKNNNSSNSTKLPFPSNVVGTFSCHGIEPLPLRRFLGSEDLKSRILSSTPLIHSKINQDRGVVAHPYGNHKNVALFGVFDGHGTHGDDVAHYAMKETLKRLKSHPLFVINTDNDFDRHFENISKAFCDIFCQMDRDLHRQMTHENKYIDHITSGTTACVVLVRDNALYIANIGDSRAVLAVPLQDRSAYRTMDLTQDQYPFLPEERQRLEDCGGYISQRDSLTGRVWNCPPHRARDSHSQWHVPAYGLAMSRSIGDHILEKCGVIAQPVVTFHQLPQPAPDRSDAKEMFLILASDGVWSVLDSCEAVKIVQEALEQYHNDASIACEILIETAMERWTDIEGEYRDDITAIVVRLERLFD